MVRDRPRAKDVLFLRAKESFRVLMGKGDMRLRLQSSGRPTILPRGEGVLFAGLQPSTFLLFVRRSQATGRKRAMSSCFIQLNVRRVEGVRNRYSQHLQLLTSTGGKFC